MSEVYPDARETWKRGSMAVGGFGPVPRCTKDGPLMYTVTC